MYENCVSVYRAAVGKEKDQVKQPLPFKLAKCFADTLFCLLHFVLLLPLKQNLSTLKQRMDTAAWTVISEMNNFHKLRIADLKAILHEFVMDQINHHYRVAQNWENLLPSVEDMDQFPDM